MSVSQATPSMSAASRVPAPKARRLSLLRASQAESRKLLDTTTNRVLLMIDLLICLAFVVGRLFLMETPTTFGDLAVMGMGSTGMLLAVLGVLLVSAEFSVPTAPCTFVLDPARGRILVAKALAICELTIGVPLAGLVFAAIGTPLAALLGGVEVTWTADIARLGWWIIANVFVALSGAAMGLAFQNAPAALVVELAWPTIALFAQSLPGRLSLIADFLELPPIDAVLAGTSDGALHACASLCFWILVPGVIGTWRTVKADF